MRKSGPHPHDRLIRIVLGTLTAGGLVAVVVGVAALPVTTEKTPITSSSTTLRSTASAVTFDEPTYAARGGSTSVVAGEDPAGAFDSATSTPATSTPATTTPATTTPATTTPATTTPATTLPPAGPVHMVVSEDTMIMGEALILRPGDSIEFRNGARLMFHHGAWADWQGTPTSTWSDDGQVQNLERDIEIFGSGDIMFMEGSLPSIIRYVEIDLQPLPQLGHYPLHWHFVGNGSRGTLVEGVVVKNSTNRAFVPHASHGITFRDTIAKNIAGQAYWWDSPPSPTDESNNSENILYDHALADGIADKVGDNSGGRIAAFELGAGIGNTVRDSVALNVTASGKNCAAFTWPEINVHQPGAWTFENNRAFGSECLGIFVWQNTNQTHIVAGFRGDSIEHGAYGNTFEYRNVDVDRVLVHASGWAMSGGRVSEIFTLRHRSEGPTQFSNLDIGRLVINNASNSGTVPGHYVFAGTTLICGNVVVESMVPGTTVMIDGIFCPLPRAG